VNALRDGINALFAHFPVGEALCLLVTAEGVCAGYCRDSYFKFDTEMYCN
jgi:hypothetical protein